MEFRDVVRRRRMVRNYDPDRPVPPELVERLLAHAIRAPSAGFSQGWGFLVLDRPADVDRFWEATIPGPDTRAGQSRAGRNMTRWLTGMRTAPVIVVAHSHKDTYLDRYAAEDKGWTDRDESRWPVPYWHVDAGMAALLMLLTAVDEGLGACFFGIAPEMIDSYRTAFGVPPSYTPIGAVSIGWPAPDHRSKSLARGRRGVDEVVHRGRW